MEKSNNKIIIECPHCKKDSTVELRDANCPKCEKSIAGIRFKKAAFSVLMSGILVSTGLFGYRQYEKNLHRYPVSTEFAIIDQCVSGSGGRLYKDDLQNKLQICLYSLEQTQKNISYSDFKESSASFMNEFQKHVYEAVRN